MPRSPSSPTRAATLLLGWALFLLAHAPAAAPESGTRPPIDLSALEGRNERIGEGILNLVTLEQIDAALRSGTGALEIDLREIERLLDGSTIDPLSIYGSAQAGPYPFEAAETGFAYKRFRKHCRITGGRGALQLAGLLRQRANSEGWTDGGRVCVRLDLRLAQDGPDRELGVYDTFVEFRVVADRTVKLPTLVEGPLVGLVQSADPTRVRIALATDRPTRPRVILGDGRTFSVPEPATRHEIEIKGLEAGRRYSYRVEIGDAVAGPYALQAAPPAGEGSVTFAYAGDTREGMGGRMAAFMGHNQVVLERLASLASTKGAAFLLMGGDLVSGYTSDPRDFRTQLMAWKQTAAGFWNERPIYPCIGNHDALMRAYDRLELDRWPYETESAEAVFAEMFLNPDNAPAPSDPRRPPYRETVFAFHYGPVLVIAYNNNYWFSNDPSVAGGCPEGYLFDDQLAWIRDRVAEGEADPNVRYTILYAQEPVFPCGGHLRDAMWHNGSNRVRAYTVPPDAAPGSGPVPEKKGMLEVRNELVRIVASSRKVAAVLASDEHAYYRLLIDHEVPIGETERDDLDGNGRLGDPGETLSPLADLRYPVWYLTSGGGGATYYSEEPTPWSGFWRARGVAGREENDRFYASSQENILIFRADSSRIGVEVFNSHGERIDGIDDLMAVKR